MATSAFNKFNSFVEALAEGEHDLGSDELHLLLCAAANAPTATDERRSDLTEIAYTNLTTTVLVQTGSAQSSGTYKLSLADRVISAVGGDAAAFRYLVLNNKTRSDASPEGRSLIGYYDYGEDLLLEAGEHLTADFDAVNGVLTLA